MNRRISYNIQYKDIWFNVDIKFISNYPVITNVIHAGEEITDLLSDKALDALTDIVKAEIEANQKRWDAVIDAFQEVDPWQNALGQGPLGPNPLDKFPAIRSKA